jgi:AcrR family transcriptional regulator
VPTDAPLRRDASRNRERLLVAARELFAERGLHVAMEEIARAAGVGVGTVYRRFGSREALIAALFDDRIQELVAIAEDAAADPDPGRGLELLLERTMAIQAADRALHDLMIGDAEAHQRLATVREQMLLLLEDLVRRAQAAGRLRPDIAFSDVPVVTLMLREVVEFSRDIAPELWRRYLTLLLDGLRGERSPLPQPPLGPDELETAMACHQPRRR